MYDFKDFVSNVKEGMEKIYPELDISIKDIIKNNDTIYKALVISSQQNNASPTIYLDGSYARYQAGDNMDTIIASVSEQYQEALHNSDFDESRIKDLSKYFIKVVNRESNKMYLADTPYFEYEDFALTLRCLIFKDKNNIASAKVTNSILDSIGLSKDEVFRIAKENTIRFFPPTAEKISDIINNSFSGEYMVPDSDMYVLTNDCGVNGATVMIYDDFISEFIKQHGECYMIPASIHEVIMLPRQYFEGDEDLLRKYVKEVNKTAVSKTDYLSDNIYLANENGISLIEGMEKEDYMDM
ncbi:MAG: hypothetical protein IJ141_04460 [Lachnospiraceae bacterium]|nr:hypothetical protein [Lachnospiraceae bacterium]